MYGCIFLDCCLTNAPETSSMALPRSTIYVLPIKCCSFEDRRFTLSSRHLSHCRSAVRLGRCKWHGEIEDARFGNRPNCWRVCVEEKHSRATFPWLSLLLETTIGLLRRTISGIPQESEIFNENSSDVARSCPPLNRDRYLSPPPLAQNLP
jgi:hypothetical protein